VAPTSTDTRIENIARASSGFLYLISRAGVTGAREALPPELPGLTRRIRKFTTLPIAVGFGISLPTHVTALGGLADAAVVGSALVAEGERAGSAGTPGRAGGGGGAGGLGGSRGAGGRGARPRAERGRPARHQPARSGFATRVER